MLILEKQSDIQHRGVLMVAPISCLYQGGCNRQSPIHTSFLYNKLANFIISAYPVAWQSHYQLLA